MSVKKNLLLYAFLFSFLIDNAIAENLVRSDLNNVELEKVIRVLKCGECIM